MFNHLNKLKKVLISVDLFFSTDRQRETFNMKTDDAEKIGCSKT